MFYQQQIPNVQNIPQVGTQFDFNLISAIEEISSCFAAKEWDVWLYSHQLWCHLWKYEVSKVCISLLWACV